MALPPPTASLSVDGLTVIPPGAERPAVANVGFELPAGGALGVIGPNGAGKSSLVRALVGAWSPVKGHVRLDGADLEQWEREALGRHVGYLPQDGELFAGTVAQNIARFDPDAAAPAIVAAARAAGVHETILKLPGGYATSAAHRAGPCPLW